jgi:hypothetical protein
MMILGLRMSKVAVIRPDGKQGYVPADRLGDALSKGGFQLTNPMQKIPVINSQGKSGYVPANRLNDALSKGGFQLGSQPQESHSYLERAGQFAKGALSGFGRSALEEGANQSQAGVMDIGGGAVPISTSSAMANIPGKGVEALESMRPSKNDSLGNTLYHAGEFGGGVASFPTSLGAGTLAKGLGNLGKNVGMGTAIGGASGALQEGGVNPVTADLTSILGLPLGTAGIKSAAKGTGNLFSKFFSPLKTQPKKLDRFEQATGDILREKVGEKNIPTVLSRLQANSSPFGTTPPTAELAQNTGISHLHRTMAPNIAAIAEKESLNDAIIRKQLETISPKSGITPEYAGETIRNDLSKTLNRNIKTRAETTAPLYEKVNELKQGIDLPNTRAFLEKEGKYAKGDIKKNLNYIEDIIRSNATAKKEIGGFDKLYGNFGPKAQAQLKKEVIGQPLPVEVTNALKDISGRIGAAKKSGNNEVARILTGARENILADMASIPEEQIARSTYANLSKPVSAIEKENLLSRFVKKDQFGEDFVLSPEKIPDMILSGSIKNTKALVSQVGKNKETMDIIRSSIVDKLLKTSELASSNALGEHNLSYNKVNNFLKKNREKLNLIFDKDQVQVLEDVKEILKRRNMVATMGRAVASNTQSETTLLTTILNPTINTITSKVLKKIPGGNYILPIYEAGKGYEKQQIKALLEKALLEPQTAKTLLTPMKNIKDERTLTSLLIPLIATDLNVNREE